MSDQPSSNPNPPGPAPTEPGPDRGSEPVSVREALNAPDAVAVVAIEGRIEQAMRREHPVVFWITLLIPVVGWAVLLTTAALTRGKGFAIKLLAITVAVEAVAGRFVILGGSHEGQAESSPLLLSRVELFWLVTWIDLCVCLLFLYHATFIYRIWRIGPWLERVRDTSRGIVARRPWLGRFSFVGVVLYVGLPILGSGAVLGSMLGQLLGLRRLTTLAAVMIGTLLGNCLMLLLAELIMRVPFLARQNPAVILGSLVLFGAVLLLVQWRLSRRARPGARADGEGSGQSAG
jgi:uncharacterized membrane protein